MLEKFHIETTQICVSCKNVWVRSWDEIIYKTLPAYIGKFQLVKCAIQVSQTCEIVISEKCHYLNMLQFIPDFIQIDNYLPYGVCHYVCVDIVSYQTVYQSYKADIK